VSVIKEITLGLYSCARVYAQVVEVAEHAPSDCSDIVTAGKRRLDAAALRFSAAYVRRTGEAGSESTALALENLADLLALGPDFIEFPTIKDSDVEEPARQQAAGSTVPTPRIGQAPKCHQDPADDAARCAVHDEIPTWHSEVPGYRGPAGWYCYEGGHVFDSQTSDAALRAYSAGQDAKNAKRESERRAERAAGREHIERVVREAISTDLEMERTLNPSAIARRVADRLSVPVLSAEEHEHVSYFASRMRDELPMLCSILDRLIAGAKP